MMKKRALTVVVAGVLWLIVVVAPGVSRMAGAQPEPPVLSVDPSRGPCDGPLKAQGSGFEPTLAQEERLPVYLLLPGTTDVNMREWGVAWVKYDGTFTLDLGPGLQRCDAAELDSQADSPLGYLAIAVSAGGPDVRPGERIPNIIAAAQYAYTTTAPPSEPTMAAYPASGPCSFPTKVMGNGFERPADPNVVLGLYLLQPGTGDINMGILNPAFPDGDGTFAQWVPLWKHGCDAAALDSQAGSPTGYLAIAAAPGGPAVEPGERIPNIIAVAQYRYTTTTPPPPPVMAVSPSSGPCDATVEVRATGFQPDQGITLGWAYPRSEAPLGTLALVSADPQGALAVTLSLGETGCAAAQAYASSGDPLPPRLRIDALGTDFPVQVGSSLATVFYTFTTMQIGAGGPARALPATGTGPGRSSAPVPWAPLTGAMAALGVILVAASLHGRRPSR